MTWTPPQAVDARLIGRHQVISGTLLTNDEALIQNCDAVLGGGQRLVLRRLQEGALLLVSFTSGNRARPESVSMNFTDQKGMHPRKSLMFYRTLRTCRREAS
ncbi:hypothetical protein OAK97_01870 [bacterium]|nr:hypothetical protein [bacterium]